MRAKTIVVGKNQTALPFTAIFFSPRSYARRFPSVSLMLSSDWIPIARINNPARSIERNKLVERPYQIAVPTAGHRI